MKELEDIAAIEDYESLRLNDSQAPGGRKCYPLPGKHF